MLPRDSFAISFFIVPALPHCLHCSCVPMSAVSLAWLLLVRREQQTNTSCGAQGQTVLRSTTSLRNNENHEIAKTKHRRSQKDLLTSLRYPDVLRGFFLQSHEDLVDAHVSSSSLNVCFQTRLGTTEYARRP